MNQPEPFGRYLLLGCVAIGGMAEIYRARFADPNAEQRDLAIKRILPSYTEDEGFVTMFKDEGNIARRLEHPNIVRVFDIDEYRGDWYIAMEFIHGTDLRILSDACEKYGKRFTPCQVARIMCETAKALDYAHHCTDDQGAPLNIVHRDATPHNIMVSYDGRVKLMDFGIAKAASRATKTRVGTVKGKTSYMSPEQARGKALDGRSDMFTLGTVTWEILTGNRLFKAPTDYEILSKVLKASIIHPSDMDPNIPRELGDIVMTTLNRDIKERYASCGKLAEALENYLTWHGDGSEKQLGAWVAALTNQQGRNPSEIPDYHAAQGLYRMNEMGNIEPLQGIAPQAATPYQSQQNLAAPVNPGFAPPVMPQSPAPYPPVGGYPPPMDMYTSGQSRAKLPWGFLITAAVLLLFSAVFMFFALSSSSTADSAPNGFVAPAANITIKSIPPGASVTLNGQSIEGKTPIAQQQAKLGDTIKLEFQLEGHEPLTIERTLLALSTDVVAELTNSAAAEKKKSQTASLNVNTKPEGLTIRVNGEDKGKSPVELKDLPLEQIISIEAVEEGEDSGELKFYTPTKTGQDEILIASNTKPEPAKAAPPPAKKSTSSKATPSKPKKPSTNKATTASGKGTLSVKATPWATVSIDGKRIGNTPIMNREVSAGAHTVELTFLPKQKRVKKKVTVKNGASATVGYNFTTDSWF